MHSYPYRFYDRALPCKNTVGLMEPLVPGKMDSIGLTADYPSIGTLYEKQAMKQP